MADNAAKPSSADKLKTLTDLLAGPPPPPKQPGLAGDLAREAGSGAAVGSGALLGGYGEAFNAGVSNIPAKDRLFGAGPGNTIKTAGQKLAEYGGTIAEGESDASKKAKADSTPTLDLAHPADTFSLGKAPSLRGYALQASNLVGQAVPVMAAARLRGGVSAAPFAGSVLGGGLASQQENERINAMSDEDIAKVPGYQQRVAKGMTPAQARADLATAAGEGAFKAAAPTGALTAVSEGLPLTAAGQGILSKVFGNSRAARVLGGATTATTIGAAHGAAFGAAQTAGANAATGENRSVSEGAGSMALLSGLASLVPGALGGLRKVEPHADEGATQAPPVSDAAAGAPEGAAADPAAATNTPPAAGVSDVPAATRKGLQPPGPLPEAGPEESAAATPPEPPAEQVPTVADQAPAFAGGDQHPVTGEVEVAPGVHVDPEHGPLSKTLAHAAERGDMDRPATTTLSDGTVLHTDTGEVLKPGDPEANKPQETPEQPKAPKPSADQLDQIILERLNKPNTILDSKTTAQIAKSLGVTLGDISSSKKRVSRFIEQQKAENSKDATLPRGKTDELPTETTQQKPSEPLSADAGVNAPEHGRDEGANGAEAAAEGGEGPVANDSGALTKALSKTDRATGPDGAKYIVSKNADGDGYHFNRAEDGDVKQHRSNDEEQPWTREEAVQAAAVMAIEKAGKTKETTNGAPIAKPAGDGETLRPKAVPDRASISVLDAEVRPAVAAPVEAKPERPAGKGADAGAAQPVSGGTAAPIGWEKNAIKARKLAKQLGVEAPSGKLSDLVPAIKKAQGIDNMTAVPEYKAALPGKKGRPSTAELSVAKDDNGKYRYAQSHHTSRGGGGHSYGISPAFETAHEARVAGAEAMLKELAKSPDNEAHGKEIERIRAFAEKEKAGAGKALKPSNETTRAEPAPSKPVVKANKIFTEDAYAKAKETLRKKLSQHGAGLDPELLHAGIVAAGYHIEKGARTFSAYAKAMVAEFGDAVKPHLASWYEAIRRHPGAEDMAKEMSTTVDVDKSHAAGIPELNEGKTDEKANAANEKGTGEAGSETTSARGRDPGNAPHDDGETGAGSGRGANNTVTLDDGAATVEEAAKEKAQGEVQSQQGGKDDGNAAAVGNVADRRANAAERERIAALPPEKRKTEIEHLRERTAALEKELRTSAVTGNRNKKAFEEDEALGWAGVSAIDMDGMKHANTVLGHSIADNLLKAIGAHLTANETDAIRFYHRSGDEFAARFKDVTEGAKIVERVQAELAKQKLTLTDGKRSFVYDGIGISVGHGDTYESADERTSQNKADRLARGERDDPSKPGNPERIREVTAGGLSSDRSDVPQKRTIPEGSDAQGVTDGGDVRSTVVDDGGAPTLEAAPAEALRTLEKQRDTGKQPAASGEPDTGAAAPARKGRGQPGAGVAGRSARVSDPRSEAIQHEVAESIAKREIAVQQPAGAAPSNFTIPHDFPLGEGGARTKAAANLDAIRTLKKIEAEGRRATPAEQAVLARYVGWGGIKQAFAHPTRGAVKGWGKLVADMEKHLTPEELEAARRSIQDAHYTSREVVNGVYHGLQHLGFDGGITLEPSMGTGNFLGLAPKELRGAMRWKGVELDPITGRIAQQLYPEASIIAGKGFQDVVLPENHFDAVVGNPPFGSQTLFDVANKDLKGFSIHNFFFAKALKALKPGGVMSMVVSHQMLDKLGGKQRRWLSERARLVGAVRLPDTAFKANAGTEVTTDIVFLQKLRPGEEATDKSWTELGSVPDPAGGEAIPLNKYFVEHPEMMLGDMTRQGRMRFKNQPTLTARDGVDLQTAIQNAVEKMDKGVVDRPAPIMPGESQPYADVNPGTPVYGHYFDDAGVLRQRLPDEFDKPASRAVDLTGRDVERMRGMIDLRDRMKGLMRGEKKDIPEAALNAQRAALNKAYDAFQKKFGYLNNGYNANLFRDDPDTYRVRSLEKDYARLDHADAAARGIEIPKGKKSVEVANKADILKSRVLYPERAPKAQTPADALGISLNTHGRVHLDAMADMLGKPKEQILAELGDQLFEDPKAGYVTADDYLSGNVKAKLAEARAQAARDPAFERNVRALEGVQPADIAPADIRVSLGSPWVHPEAYAAFADEVLGMGKVKLAKIEALQKFAVVGGTRGHERFGTQRFSASDLFKKAVSREAIQVFRTEYVDGKEKRVLDGDATAAAQAAVDAMREEFGNWVWKDKDRRDRLHRTYNDTYNTDRPRTHVGDFLTFPGKVGDEHITFRPTQQNAIWRSIQDGKVLMDHVVGAGKTYTAIAAAMKKRQMGLARKPMVAVPNHLVQQWAADWMRLYPDANILAVTQNDFTKDRRKLLFSRIATGDWDAVIVAHSQFSRIKPPADFEARYMQSKLEEYRQAKEQAKAGGEDHRTLAQIEKSIEQTKEKIKSKMEGITRDENTAHFDEMGVDDLTVDEAHEFKNLGFVTNKRNVSGMGSAANGGSQKAEDLFIKTRYLNELNGGRGLSLLTGTPVSNSLAEMFTMQRYLSYDDMKARGVHLFDLWANTFAEESTQYELDSSGRGLKPKTVLSKFTNVPEMMQLYKRYADTITMADLQRSYKERTGKDWPVPKVKGGRAQNIVVQPSPGLLHYIENNIIPRMEAISGERGAKPDPSVDNMLKVTNDARLAALDVRLKDPNAPDDVNSKPNQMIQRAMDLYRRTTKDRGTQLIFCDLSTPKAAAAKARAEFEELSRQAAAGDEDAQAALDKMSPDDMLSLSANFSVYDDVRQKLVAAGVPPREIAFIHDANTDLQKKSLFDKVNAGDVRFLMGSTAKMGAGTNVQRLMVGLHHLDAPWRPSDLEQREGRGIRQGNVLAVDKEGNHIPGFELEVNRYAAERTYDARMWQLIERKAGIVEQIRKGDPNLREVDDIGGESANAAEMKAAATGNPLLIEHVETEGTVKRLTSLKRSYDNRRYDAESELARLAGSGGPEGRYQTALQRVEAGERALAANPYEPFNIRIGDKTIDDYKAGTQALAVKIIDALDTMDKNGNKPTEIGTFRGARMTMQNDLGIKNIHLRYDDAKLGDIGQIADTVDADGGVSGAGVVAKLNNRIKAMSEWRNGAEYAKQRDEKRQAELTDLMAQPFKQQDALTTASARLKEINAELVKAAAPKTKEQPKPFVKPDDSADFGHAANLLRTPELASAHAKAIDAMAQKVAKNVKGVRVVTLERPDQLPPRSDGQITARFDNARGLVRRLADGTATVYLNAQNLGSLEQARKTLAHELVGHIGMEKLLGDNFERVASDALALVRSGDKYKDIRQRVARYEADGERVMGMEALAMMAEGKFKNGVLARVYAAIRKFLRDIGLHDAAFSHEEIVAMVGAAARNMEGQQVIRAPVPGERKSPFAESFDLAEGQTLADAPPDRVQEAIAEAAKMHLRGIPDAVVAKIQDWKPGLLGALTVRQMADLAKEYLPQVQQYADTMQRMMTRRNQLESEHAPTAKKWEQFQREARKRATREQVRDHDTDSDRMTAIMHDSTLAGADPDKPFEPGSVKLSSGQAIAASDGHAVADQLEAKAAKMSGPGAELLQRDAQRLREAADNEAPRQAAYPELKKRFDALPDKAKEIYREARDLYARRADDMLNALLGRIDSLEVPNGEKVSLTNQMRAYFESSRVTAPYFPLARFGEYWVSAEKDGKREFRMMESRQQQKRILAAYKAEGYDVRGGTKISNVRAQDGASGSFMASVTKVLADNGVPSEAADEIYQLYLRTLPDMSVRKNFIHRKGTPGYDSDALRAFSAHAQHGTYQLSRMEHAPALESGMRAMNEQVADHTKEGDDTAAVSAGRMYDEMQKRHEWVMNPKHSSTVQKLTSSAFVYYLATSPAQALVNITQNLITAFPVIAAKHGYVKALTELTRGMGQTIKTYGHTEKLLTGDEARAYKELVDAGAIDRTFVHDIAGLGDADTRNYSDTSHRVMQAMSHFFHKSEVMNRESTGMAAYRLERAAGASHEEAVAAARDVIWESHFDYSNANRARWMQGNIGKLAFAMKQYSQNMTYYLWRNAYQTFKGATPAERSMALRKLTGTLGMTAVFAGALGMPLMSMMFSAANGMNALFGDPDQPYDAETEFRSFLTDHLGTDLGRTAATGLVNELTGVDFASRTKLDQMWYRDADREQEGRGAADYMLEQLAGPVGNMLVLSPFKAAQQAGKGDYERAAESLMPKFIRDYLKSYRYGTEGVNDTRGNSVVPDLSPFELAGQAAGFTPARVAEQYSVNNALHNYQQAITDRRKALIDGYAMATRLNDTEGVRSAYEKIAAFNTANPEVQISGSALRRMLTAREKYNERAINGLVLNKKLDARVRAAADFDQEDESPSPNASLFGN